MPGAEGGIIRSVAGGIGRFFKGGTVPRSVASGTRVIKGAGSRNIMADDLKEQIDNLKNLLSPEERREYVELFMHKRFSTQLQDEKMRFFMGKKIPLSNARIPSALGLLSDIRAYAVLKVPGRPIQLRFSAETLERLAKGREPYDLIRKLQDIIRSKDSSSFLTTKNNGIYLELSHDNHSITGLIGNDGIYTF